MNPKLESLAAEIGLSSPANEPLRLAFALACARRIEHLVEDSRALDALKTLDDYVRGNASADALQQASAAMQLIANQHPGSRSLDGGAHAAVSATYAIANAVAGRAIQAADYAAYATVYAYGGYAVKDPDAFTPEFEWQVAELRRLSAAHPHEAAPPAPSSPSPSP